MADREHPGELGAFLKACRARLQPEQAGLTSYGGRRRVAGLRREELALLAGVSPSYYARLEQGQSRHASPQVIEAIAAALSLAPPEREHLLTAMRDVPTIILGRRSDVLAWNPMGHALLACHLDRASVNVPGRRPNMAEVIFLDPDSRELYVDWDRKARAVVGNLRLVTGAHPDDPALASLIGKLAMASPHFNALWADQHVQACATARYTLRHPQIGNLTVTQQTLRSVERPDQTLVTCTAPPESASAAALAVLAHLAYDTTPSSSSSGSPNQPASGEPGRWREPRRAH